MINISAAGDIVSVTPDPVKVCRNGKVTFESSDGLDFGIVFSPNNGSKVDLNKDIWSSGGKHEVKVKNLIHGGCAEYTVIRKLGGGNMTFLDPVLIIDK